ncbi:hypothetical protein [Fredinandcohnia sp. 179-A 10B2 NHS]|uniref:hypothetical protein n=1 Tax=Fredinandcohnia sp. 179-A 10B2 NHS TaxID=3235176 RepID=UPI00399FD358
MDLIKFELYKIFRQKIIYITFLLSIIFSTGFTFDSTAQWEKDLYREWEGPITVEKVEQAKLDNEELMKKLDEAEENFIYSESDQVKSGIYETIAWIQQVNENKLNKLAELKAETKYNTELQKSLVEDIDVSYFAYNKGPREVVDFASFYSIIFTGGMLLIGLSTIYTNEYSSGVDNYLLSSKKGRKPLMWSKIIASMIYTVVVVIAWEMWNVGYSVLRYGNEGWNTAIQYSFKYYFSPYSFTLLEYHMIQLGIHLIGALAFAVLIVFISSLCKNALISIMVNGAIYAVPVMIVETYTSLPLWLTDVFRFSFVYIMKVEFLFDNFRTINLFGTPVLYPIAAIVLMVVVAVVFVSCLTRVVKNREVTS